MTDLKHNKVSKRDIPKEFCEDTVKRILRLENCHNVIGVLYLKGPTLELYTVPEITAQLLTAKLPPINVAMRRAITEIDIQNELVAYRIEATSFEIAVAGFSEFTACVVHKLKHRRKKHVEKHIKTHNN